MSRAMLVAAYTDDNGDTISRVVNVDPEVLNLILTAAVRGVCANGIPTASQLTECAAYDALEELTEVVRDL